MAEIVRAALVQTDWPGSKEAMIDKHETAAREAAAQGAKVICFQELFYGPYFCQVQEVEYEVAGTFGDAPVAPRASRPHRLANEGAEAATSLDGSDGRQRLPRFADCRG